MRDYTMVDGRSIPNDLIDMLKLIANGDLAKAAESIRVYWSSEVERAINYLGFKMLGQGSFSTVFHIPGSDDVIKMNHNPDDHWVKYAKYARINAAINPMLPKVFELHQHPDNGMVIARMEKLDAIDYVRTIGMRDVVVSLSGDLKHGQMSKRGIRNKTLKYLHDKFDFGYTGSYSAINLAKIVVWMTNTIKANPDVRVDCHYANWMLRGRELVLNDPLAD